MEVSLALGLAGFALIAVIGALPAGLRAVREAQSQEIAANVAQRLQASLQSIAFAVSSTGTTVANLGASTRYFTEDGVETVSPTSAGGSTSPAFYKAVFAVGSATFKDGSPVSADMPAIQAANARNITVTLYYPQNGIVQGKRKFVYSFLVARQQAGN